MSGFELAAAVPIVEGVSAAEWSAMGMTAIGANVATPAVTVGSVLSTAGTIGNVLQAGSLLAGGFAQGAASDYNASAGNAAALATEDAAARNAFALERANRIEASNLARQQQQAKARRAVAQGTSGVAMAGSPIEVEAGASWQDEFNLTQTQQTGELAVSNIYYDAAQRAQKLRTQAALDSYMGTQSRVKGALSAGGSLLTAGAKKYGGSIYGA